MGDDARGTADPGLSGVYGRLGASFAALAAGVGAVIVAVLLLQGLAPITSTAATSLPPVVTTTASTTTTASSSSRFPSPPAGATVLAAQAGQDALGLAVVPGNGSVTLQASVVGYPKGISGGISGLSVRFEVEGRDGSGVTARAVACGAGCYRATAHVAVPAKVTVVLTPHSPSRVSFTLPATWPPAPAGATVAKAATVWRGLRTLMFHDRLSTGGTVTLHTLWKVVAPNRIAYTVTGGGSSVIIGDHRWDKPSGGTSWTASPQAPVVQPQPFWVRATDARLLGTVTVGGRPAWKISFFDPATPGWFTILVDTSTMHTVDVRMTAVAHFMHDTYGPFNSALSIVPPK